MTRAIRTWLLALCALAVAMVVVGGVTRLSGAGLSITRWAPLSGALPPLDAAAWDDAFARYRASPEGRLVRPGLDLAGFQTLFWIEWAHRLLARGVGLALVAPRAWFAGRRAIDRRRGARLALVVTLAASQALSGWWMVASGLVDAPHVSPYRLAVHLLVGFLIFGVLLWTALDLGPDARVTVAPRTRRATRMLVALVLLVVVSGAAMAGTRAGWLYATFPTMNGAWIPDGVFERGPRSAFEHAVTAHFDHRLLALVLVTAVAWVAFVVRAEAPIVRRRAAMVIAAAALQIGLGAATVILHVPIAVAVAHQAGGLVVLATSLALAHAARVTSSSG